MIAKRVWITTDQRVAAEIKNEITTRHAEIYRRMCRDVMYSNRWMFIAGVLAGFLAGLWVGTNVL